MHQMILGVLETLLGLLILNTSIKSLRRSAIRKWKEGYYITLFLSFIIITFGLVSTLVNLPSSISTAFMFISNFAMFISLFRISKMKGLGA